PLALGGPPDCGLADRTAHDERLAVAIAGSVLAALRPCRPLLFEVLQQFVGPVNLLQSLGNNRISTLGRCTVTRHQQRYVIFHGQARCCPRGVPPALTWIDRRRRGSVDMLPSAIGR